MVGNSVMHNNPNPFTGNEPGMGFGLIGRGSFDGVSSSGNGRDRLEILESRIRQLEDILGMSDSDTEESMDGGLSSLLFGMV